MTTWHPTRLRKLAESGSAVYFLWQAMFSSRPLSLLCRTSACRNTVAVHAYFPARAAFSTTVVARHNTAADSTVARNVQRTPATSNLKTETPKKRRPVAKKKSTAEVGTADHLEEQLESLDTMHAAEDQLTMDVWASPVDTFGKRVEDAVYPSNL